MTSINKHSLISAISAITAISSYGSSLCTALILCACSTLGSCTNDSDPLAGEGSQSRQPLTIRVSASSFTSLLHEGTPSTRIPTEDGYETVFKNGDAIGVFAIKDIGTSTASYADNINNLKLVCNVDPTTQKVTWIPEDPNKILYNYNDLTYIAYYPYKEGITISISGSATSTAILQQLAANTNLRPLNDQSTQANYTASDLMTAVATPAPDPSSGTNNLIDLRFQHRHSLLVFKPQIVTPCIAPADAGFVYRDGAKVTATDLNASDVIINNVIPHKMPDGSYRAIVRSSTTSAKITGSYASTNGAPSSTPSPILYSSDNSIAFAAGSYYTLNVIKPLSSVGNATRALQPGDFVFHGTDKIEIYPGDGDLDADGKIPGYSQAVGIVVTCDPARISENDKNNGWTHAYVMGLNSKTNVSWGAAVDENVLPNIGRDAAPNYMDGYKDTEAMLTAYSSNLASYGCFSELMNFRSGNPIPSGLASLRSPWFVPSIGQWFDVIANLCGISPNDFRDNSDKDWYDYNYGQLLWDNINARLSKVDKPLSLIYDMRSVYLSSTETTDGEVWKFWFIFKNRSEIGLLPHYKGVGNRDQALYPFFAF